MRPTQLTASGRKPLNIFTIHLVGGIPKGLGEFLDEGYILVTVQCFRRVPENMALENPLEAARRGARPALRQRFYANARTAPVPHGHAVCLDDKSVLTPARRALVAPVPALAAAIAAEWDSQRDVVDPGKMPLTRLANVIIDGVSEQPLPVAAEIAKYLASDLLIYRAADPPGLIERQQFHWDPILAWAAESLDARFQAVEGITYLAQPEGALKAAEAAIPVRSMAARSGAFGHDVDRLGLACARARLRTRVRRSDLGRRQCR